MNTFPNDFFNSLNKQLKLNAEQGNFTEFKYLVSLDKNLNGDYSYCLRTATAKGFFPIVQYIVENINKNLINTTDSLSWAAIKGDVPLFVYLIEQGANIHQNNNYIFKRTIASSKDNYGFKSNLNILEYLYDSFNSVLMETIANVNNINKDNFSINSENSLLFKWIEMKKLTDQLNLVKNQSVKNVIKI